MIAVDTGFFVALADADDHHHRLAMRWLHTAEQGWVTTWPVITEVSYMLGIRVGEAAKHTFIDDLTEGTIEIWDIPRTQAQRIGSLMKKYATLPMDLADASLVLLAEHMGHGRILTTDQRDFGAYRWKNTKPFVDLMARGPAP